MNRTCVCCLLVVLAGIQADARADDDQKQPVRRGTLRFVESEFGRSMDAGSGGIRIDIPENSVVQPLTVQLRFRIEPRSFRFRNSLLTAVHREEVVWRIFSETKEDLRIEVAGKPPQLLKSLVPIADGKWHDLHVEFSKTLKLTLDGTPISNRGIDWKKIAPAQSFWVGQSADGETGCDGWLDDVLISKGVREVASAWKGNADSLVWLDFEESSAEYLSKWTPRPSLRATAEPWEKETDADWEDSRFLGMLKGPVISCSTRLPSRYAGPKNICLHQAGDAGVWMMFDTQRCVMTASHEDAAVNFSPLRFGILRMPELGGEELFYADARQAWRIPGAEGKPSRVLDPDDVRFGGYHRHEDGIVLDYEIHGADCLESYAAGPSPSDGEWDTLISLERLFLFGKKRPLKKPVFLTLAEVPYDAPGVVSGRVVHVKTKSRTFEFRLTSDHPAVRLLREGNRILMRVPAGKAAISLVCLFAQQEDDADPKELFSPEYRGGSPGFLPPQAKKVENIDFFMNRRMKGGTLMWGASFRQPVQREASVSGMPFRVESMPPRFNNPYEALFFLTGIDFFESGTTAAVSTVHGDVWLVEGLDTDSVVWSRFATGLYQPLGIRIVNGKISVLCRDQITRLHDRDGDGEADFYENFNNDLVITGTPHAYASCLETDPAGNFYFFKCGRSLPHGGKLLRVSADGRKLDVFASGYRHPIGLGVSPTGLVTAADNQGNWIPASAIQVVRPGSFHGYMPEVHQPDRPDSFDQPMCWIPHSVDNSSGGQVWVPKDTWGPFAGKMLHLSWGRCTMHLALMEQVDGVWQGGTVEFPGIRFRSGPIMGRFNPADGHLYVCGLDGWQTAAVQDGSLQRVCYTSGEAFMPIELRAEEGALRITFTQPVDATTARDLASYDIEQWQYRWNSEYGSPELSIRNPGRIGHDEVPIAGVELSRDRRTVRLLIPGLKPVMQMRVELNLAPEGGSRTKRVIHNTIHRLAAPRE